MRRPGTPSTDALRPLVARLDLADRLRPYASRVWTPSTAPAPTLHIEDVSAIPFLADIEGVEEYQHRARVRADTGDLIATVTPPDPSYETYCRETLDLGQPTWIDVRSANHTLAVARACRDGAAFGRLVDEVRAAGRLVIHPYMSIEAVWVLADELARESQCEVTVLGPPPPVSWIANDKAHFTELVTRILGDEWTVETHLGRDADELARLLCDMAARHARVGLKRTRCASAMGNLVLESNELRTQAASTIVTTVTDFLARTEWPGDEPVLVVAWEAPSSSPSTQWWIRAPAEGPPRLDGIYEQILEGERGLFVGSRPSSLPDRVHTVIADVSSQVAQALQALGYVGRCSFDHLVLGEPDADFIIKFTECNGRWGGTSTPMHLVDRLVRGSRPPYRAQDFVHDRLAEATFPEIVARLGPDLFNAARQTGRFIFYNVGPLPMFGKLDVIAIGDTQAEAEQALLSDLPRRMGL